MFLVTVMAVLSACGGTTDNNTSGTDTTATTSTADNSELVVAISSDLFRTDPSWDASGSSRNVFINAYERILGFDDEGNLIPALASSYKRLDEKTWDFTLRDGAKFWDGTPVTANDVKFTIERAAKDDTSRLNSYVASIAEVQVVSDTEFKVVTTDPDAILPNRLANVFVISEASVADYDAGKIVAPLGSGPYKITVWDQNKQVVLERNENYNLGTPKIEKITFRVITEAATRIAELQAGGVDLISDLNPDMISLLSSNSNLSVKSVPSNRTMFIGFNTWGDGPLSDARVRQAINYAIDKDSIVKSLFLGYGAVSSQVVNSNAFGYNDEIKPYPYDVAKAKEMLTEACYPNGFTIDFNSPTGKYLLDKDVAQVVADQLAQVGIKVNLQLEEFNSYWDRLLNKELKGMFLMSIGNYYADPDFAIDLWLYSKKRGLYYNTPVTDALIEQEKVAMTTEERKQIFDELMTKIYNDAPWLFMVEYQDIYAVNNSLQGWEPRSDQLMIFNDAYFSS